MIEDGAETTDYSSTILLMSGNRNGSMAKCTGTIVGHNTVLTALHCMKGGPESVYAIQTNRLTRDDYGPALQTATSPQKIISHAGVTLPSTPDITFFPNDLVVLVFNSGTFSQSAVVVPSISNLERPRQFQSTIMVGFGKSSSVDSGETSIKRVGSGFYLVDDTLGKDLVFTFNRALNKETLVPEGPKKFSQALQGDSGGPLLILRDNRHDLVGVLSGGGASIDGITNRSIYVDLYSERSLSLLQKAASEGAYFTKPGEAASSDQATERGQPGAPGSCLH